METLTKDEALKLGTIVDELFSMPGNSYYKVLQSLIEEESSVTFCAYDHDPIKKAVTDFLCSYVGARSDEVNEWVYDIPAQRVPLLLADSLATQETSETFVAMQAVALWRTQLGK